MTQQCDTFELGSSHKTINANFNLAPKFLKTQMVSVYHSMTHFLRHWVGKHEYMIYLCPHCPESPYD